MPQQPPGLPTRWILPGSGRAWNEPPVTPERLGFFLVVLGPVLDRESPLYVTQTG